MRWILAALLAIAASAGATYHGETPAQDPEADQGLPDEPPGWESSPEEVGAGRDEGTGGLQSPGTILLVGAALVVAVLAAALLFASRRP